MTGINYDKIFSVIEKTLASPSLYFQSLSLILCFVISYYLYQIIRKFFSLKESKKNADFNKLATRYIFPLLYPALTLSLLSLGLVVYLHFDFDNNQIFDVIFVFALHANFVKKHLHC
jgi:hypothetical protein